MTDLAAIKAVLAEYRHTSTGVITQEMIQAAWAEYEATKAHLDSQSRRLAALNWIYRRRTGFVVTATDYMEAFKALSDDDVNVLAEDSR